MLCHTVFTPLSDHYAWTVTNLLLMKSTGFLKGNSQRMLKKGEANLLNSTNHDRQIDEWKKTHFVILLIISCGASKSAEFKELFRYI